MQDAISPSNKNGQSEAAGSKNEGFLDSLDGSDNGAKPLPSLSSAKDLSAPHSGAKKAATPQGAAAIVTPPYRDFSTFAVNTLTDNDKKTLRLYDDNAVIGGPFPVKLQIILKVAELIGQHHIISWLPHGRAFMIHRPREFEEKIMGEFFKQTKLSSFKRQLNLYDFKRVTRGPDCGSYYHEMFLKSKPLLAKRMVRRKIKGTANERNKNPLNDDDANEQPNFYNMPIVGASPLQQMQELQQMNNSAILSRMGAGIHPREQFADLQGGYGANGLNPHLQAQSLLRLQQQNALAGASALHPSAHFGADAVFPGHPGAAGLSKNLLSPHLMQQTFPPRQNDQLSSLATLQRQQQHQQVLPNGYAGAGATGGPPQQPGGDSYGVALENLNQTYAFAMDSLKRKFNGNPLNAGGIMSQNALLNAAQQQQLMNNGNGFASQPW